MSTIQSQQIPIPLDLRRELPNPLTPWQISERVFTTMAAQKGGLYKKVEVIPSDPEWRFIWRYFHHDQPHRYNIKRAYVLFERHQQQAFEANLSTIEREVDTFPPTWRVEVRADQRAQVIERWKQTTEPFSPFTTTEPDGRQRNWSKTKVLPLWQGSKEASCESIAKTGFTFFGKTKITPGKGGPTSTDEGYFGSGIYFTNSARYASDIYSQGHLVLSFVSMREPFPVVGDPTQQDMAILQGKGAYKDYNAHYIPVTSINPADPYECQYLPAMAGDTPHCDEYVVFQKTQALPRYWITLEVNLPYAYPTNPQTTGEMILSFLNILKHPDIDKDTRIRKILESRLEILLQHPEETYFEDLEDPQQYLDFYHKMTLLLIDGKIDTDVRKSIIQTTKLLANPSDFSPTPPVPKPPIKTAPGPILSETTTLPLPLTPFGKAAWAQYFGDIGPEPALPSNIREILQTPCPIWPGKKVYETHLLTLIPETVNGAPLTLRSLGELMQRPQGGGNSTKYEYFNNGEYKADTSYPSHWALFTRDVLPGSRNKPYTEQQKLVQRLGGGYEVPNVVDAAVSIVMEYVRTGVFLYPRDPWTFTRCQDKYNKDWPLVVGGFAPGGLRVRSYLDDLETLGVGGLRKF